jgi:hypothetical protein
MTGRQSLLHAPAAKARAEGSVRVLQRKCECGAHTPGGGACRSCAQPDEQTRLQLKLSFGGSSDPLESEADRVAEQVLSGPAPGGVAGAPVRIQRFSPGPSSAASAQVPPSVDRTLSGSGRPLDGATRKDMEQRFGHDFSRVRVHQDSAAGESARDVGAHAYTVGNQIVFAPGRFAPHSSEGRRLLAHELTHVVQQGGGTTQLQRQCVASPCPEALAPIRPEPATGWTSNTVKARGSDFTHLSLHRPSKEVVGSDRATADAGTGSTAAPAPSAPAAPLPSAPAAPAPSAEPAAPAEAAAPVTASLPAHIRGSSSPAAMADRIPPRVDTAISVTISNMTASSPDVVVSVDGAGGGNGELTINGAGQASLKATAVIKLRGTTQTTEGKGGSLKIVAKQGSTTLATSGGFSVSSIPQNYTDTFFELITGDSRGFVVQDGWSPDSGGPLSDLDKTEISELVEYGAGTGCFAGGTGRNSLYLPGNVLSKDSHSWPVSELTSPGTLVAAQVCQFKDNRSGSSDIPMTKSGYKVTRRNALKSAGKFALTTSKVGSAATAKGVSSAAGSGSITKTQDV